MLSVLLPLFSYVLYTVYIFSVELISELLMSGLFYGGDVVINELECVYIAKSRDNFFSLDLSHDDWHT